MQGFEVRGKIARFGPEAPSELRARIQPPHAQGRQALPPLHRGRPPQLHRAAAAAAPGEEGHGSREAAAGQRAPGVRGGLQGVGLQHAQGAAPEELEVASAPAKVSLAHPQVRELALALGARPAVRSNVELAYHTGARRLGQHPWVTARTIAGCSSISRVAPKEVHA
eukprot:CAMPEP_0175670558 /NCGR_PEP_ID=MMETSP0097-20121207/19722_1 /TAXON_ID=311494 /ORGANISM="Alexandrium monilatum, Strain CCMP3105" /LENGTH=166 /DNA_ID=CAMNT_0016977137 /DNA_START=92 /DNA_END=589 /DNA_ORIENTATION=+